MKLDPWDKAAECDRAIEIVADPERREVLSSLRSVWLALGNQPSFLDRAERAVQLSTIAQIHGALMSQCKDAMH
jgi:hypothetical protein